MKEVLTRWYRRYLSEEEAVILLAMLTMAFAVMLFFGDILAPVLVAIVLAYLMQGVANVLRQRGCQGLSVAVSRYCFLGGFFAVLFGLAPLVWRQLVALVREAPAMIEAGRKVLVTLPEEYPVFFTQQQVNELTAVIQAEMASMGQLLVTKGLVRFQRPGGDRIPDLDSLDGVFLPQGPRAVDRLVYRLLAC